MNLDFYNLIHVDSLKVKLQSMEKRVRFKNEVKVVLIPCAKEYLAADLKRKMWYTARELELFKQSYLEEYRRRRLFMSYLLC